MREDDQAWLEAFISRHGAVAGTIHTLEAGDETLSLGAAHRIPPPVLERVRAIPKGKGMAGLAWERDAPVSTCNLKTDETGDVRPGAKAVDAAAAVALPVHRDDQSFCGVVGIAFAGEREMAEDELAELHAEAEAFAKHWPT